METDIIEQFKENARLIAELKSRRQAIDEEYKSLTEKLLDLNNKLSTLANN